MARQIRASLGKTTRWTEHGALSRYLLPHSCKGPLSFRGFRATMVLPGRKDLLAAVLTSRRWVEEMAEISPSLENSVETWEGGGWTGGKSEKSPMGFSHSRFVVQ